MINKAELIRKLAKRAGVPDQESKLFFEIFLKRAGEVLKTGSALFIKQYGCFQMKRAKIKNVPGLNEAEDDPFYTDLLVFTDENTKEEEGIYFNIPLNMSFEFDPLDAYFSISLGKPVIPLKKTKNEEAFVPPAGPQLRRLIESKVDRLITESQLVEDFAKGNEVLLIDASKYNPDQFELDWAGSITRVSASASEMEREELKNIKNIPWDFGEDLSKQIEEESILDLTDAGHFLFNDTGEQEAGTEKDSQDDDFQEVKPAARNLLDVDEEAVKEEWDSLAGEERKTGVPEVEEEEISEGFSQVKFKTATQQFNPSSLNFIEESDEEFKLEESPPEEDAAESEPEPEAEQIVEEPLPAANKGWLFVFVIAGFILVSGAAYFIYVHLDEWTGKDENSADKKITASVVNRSYEIPVTYPYNKSGDTIVSDNQPIKLSALTRSASLDTSASGQTVPAEKTETAFNPDKKEKVKEFIYKYNGRYYVQVSSWPGKRTAESEAERFKREGITAVVEDVYIAGRGKWYRVLAGAFETLKEAEDFQKKQN